jgi:hypothetical protein
MDGAQVKTSGWLKFAVFCVCLAPFLFALDLIFGLPSIVGWQNTSLIEIVSRGSFDSGAWKKAANTDDPIRIKMVDDLMQTHQLVGMSRPQIDAMLGVPDKTSYFSAYDYVYWLGPERGFISIDSEWLGVRFKNQIVVEAKLLTD